MIENLFSLEGKTALVTGGAKGIGAMITQALIESGVKVYIASRKKDDCIAFADKMNALGKGKCIPGSVNLLDMESIAGYVAGISEQEKGLDILINNSGCSWAAPLGEYPEKGWDKVMDLNVKGVFFLTQALLPLLKSSASIDDPARVIMISSVAAVSTESISSYAYGPSKAAVMHLAKLLAKDLVKDNILVNTIAPAVFPSNMTKAFDLDFMAKTHPVGRVGRPEDIAGLTILLCSKAGSFMTGNYIPLDGGYLLNNKPEL